MIKNKFIFLILFAFIIISLLLSCAKIVSPSGGPVDNAPPEILSVNPENNLTNFNYNSITIEFDEFFTIKDPAKTIFINPLINREIEHKIKGKSIIVYIPDSLDDNYTYNLNLYNAIADFNEGNIIENFKYTFSKNNFIDSLEIKGVVYDAFKNEPIENINVYLFKLGSDSLLLKNQFSWLTTTDKAGVFKFNNIPKGKYNLYYLLDKDFNHIYNSLEEKVGFCDSIINVEINKVNDSTVSNLTSIKTPLYVFQEEDTMLKISKSSRIRKGLQQIILNKPLQNILISNIDNTVADSIIYTQNKTKDTISIWVVGEKKDVMKVAVLNNNLTLDTISLSLKKLGKTGNDKENYIVPKIRTYNTFNNNYIHFVDTLKLISTNPLKSINSDSIFVIHQKNFKDEIIEDTIIKEVIIDKNPLYFSLIFNFVPGEKYKIIINKNVIEDVFLQKNDSTAFEIVYTDSLYYGGLSINITDTINSCHFFEFVNSKKNVVYKFDYDNYNQKYDFHNLIPDDYILYLYIDNNCNNKWDTGNFMDRKQAERIYKSSGKVMIKSSWENDIEWSIKESN